MTKMGQVIAHAMSPVTAQREQSQEACGFEEQREVRLSRTEAAIILHGHDRDDRQIDEPRRSRSLIRTAGAAAGRTAPSSARVHVEVREFPCGAEAPATASPAFGARSRAIGRSAPHSRKTGQGLAASERSLSPTKPAGGEPPALAVPCASRTCGNTPK